MNRYATFGIALLVAGLAIARGDAVAASASRAIAVTVNVVSKCVASTDDAATTALTVRCSKGASYRIGMTRAISSGVSKQPIETIVAHVRPARTSSRAVSLQLPSALKSTPDMDSATITATVNF